MKKDSTICFRVSSKIREELEHIAQKRTISLSSLVTQFIMDRLYKKSSDKYESEKRIFDRKRIETPAVIRPFMDKHGYYQGVIIDISQGGVKISFPKKYAYKILNSEHNFEFEILFKIPDDKRPVCFECKSCRVEQDNGKDEVLIGAYFKNSDFDSYKSLNQYLVN